VCSDAAPTLIQRSLAQHSISTGYNLPVTSISSTSLPANPAPPVTNSSSSPTPNHSTPVPETPAQQPGHNGEPMDVDDTAPEAATSQTQDIANILACKRVESELARSQHPQPAPQTKARSGRSCQKCANPASCAGKRGIVFCPNPCQDCGNINCKGRNPKRKTKPCHLAWS